MKTKTETTQHTVYICEHCGSEFHDESAAKHCEEECASQRDKDLWYAEHKPKFSKGDLLVDWRSGETFICSDITESVCEKPQWAYIGYKQVYRDHLDRMQMLIRDCPIRHIESHLELAMPGAEYEEIVKTLDEYRDGIRGCKAARNDRDDWDTAIISFKSLGDNPTVTVHMSLTVTLDELREFCAKQK